MSKDKIMAEFNSLIDQIQFQGFHEKAIEVGFEKYYLKPYMINDLSPMKSRILYEKILEKFYRGKYSEQTQTWYENELRLFIWVLICYLYLKQIELQNMSFNDWKLISKVFPQKDPKLFDYQCKALFRTQFNLKDNPWDHEQIQILRLIVNGKGKRIKWNEVSKELYFASHREYYRTPKQCRERWLNHDDPDKKKGDWTAEECLSMFTYVLKNGKKWAGLVKQMEGARNEHSIKNKFNSLVKKQKKHELSPKTDEQIYKLIINRINNTIQLSSEHVPFDFGKETKKDSKTEAPGQENTKSFFPKKFMQKILTFNISKNKPKGRQEPQEKYESQEIKMQDMEQQVEFDESVENYKQLDSELFEYSQDFNQQKQNEFRNCFFIEN